MTVDELITKWEGTPGGAEKKNFPLFINDLCAVLCIDAPNEPAQTGVLGAYEYEGPVPKGSFRSLDSSGAIDLYRRGHFIMEAKQSYLKPEQVGLDLGEDARPRAPSGARYDKLMRDARLQAENYAKNLPASEPVAPFLIVCDIGRAFEIYHDSAGNGRGYTFFPDKQSYRIELKDLASDKKLKGIDRTPLDLLKAIWSAPKSVDPRFQAADVTRKVAASLAQVSQVLEEGTRIRSRATSARERAEEIEESALFLMRILFCMFAEDIGLLPEDKFKEFLLRAESNDKLFEQGLADLWQKMGAPNLSPRFAHALEQEVRYFNGGLFTETARTYQLNGIDIHHLYEAARQNWRKVEPAIFGTLLEQALTAEERAKLGAHYTPRPYVETLVRATIMDVLEPEWHTIETGEEVGMLERAQAFHERLASIRVLDPACGTGNFLYVSMELMQALESKVIETIQTLGGEAESKVGPHQFHGLEKNPRAAKIAELVLWIGWLRNRLHDDPDSVPQPVLAESASINFGRPGGYDAVLKMNALGEPDLENPMIPDWPEAEFIVGNPPFIGAKFMRDRLGSDYAEALWAANARVPKSADFVMQWWDRAAHTLTAIGSPLVRFGFVTTNSITQEFSRRVIGNYLGEGDDKISLAMAIPDHPWTKATKDSAAVRIAMTVAQRGNASGELREVVKQSRLDSDEPEIVISSATGSIHADLTTGADGTSLPPLKANEGMSSPGVKLHGAGFIVATQKARDLGLGSREGLERHLRPYRNGRDLLAASRDAMVIDLLGLEEKAVRQRFPEVYDHILRTVKPDRDANRRATYRDNWWLFGEPRREIRPALDGLPRYIATPVTAKHRIFQFLEGRILPDDALIAIADDRGETLGVLQSAIHLAWTYAASSLLGVASFEQGHRYLKSKVFDPFPFPDPTPEQRAVIADLAEELDATRKAALAETDKLTMTELYNFRAKLKSGEPMSEAEQRRATKARAAIVARLVTLNHERAAEEAEGKVRWLRPEYQKPRFEKEKKGKDAVTE